MNRIILKIKTLFPAVGVLNSDKANCAPANAAVWSPDQRQIGLAYFINTRSNTLQFKSPLVRDQTAATRIAAEKFVP